MELPEAVELAFSEYRPQLDTAARHATRLLTYDNSYYIMPTSDDSRVAKFLLRQFPNCSALTVAYGGEVEEGYRRRGIGRLMYKMFMRASQLAGYSGVVGTVREDNDACRHMLIQLGWTESTVRLKSRHGGFVRTWEVAV